MGSIPTTGSTRPPSPDRRLPDPRGALQLLLDDTSVALIESAHAAKHLASADSALMASGAPAFACRVSDDRSTVEVVLAASQATAVLANLAATRRVALVASHIQSFVTVQLKGDTAAIITATDADRRDATRYCDEFVAYAASLGYPQPVMRAHMHCPPDQAVVVRFAVRLGFNQTPGPAAGRPLATAAP